MAVVDREVSAKEQRWKQFSELRAGTLFKCSGNRYFIATSYCQADAVWVIPLSTHNRARIARREQLGDRVPLLFNETEGLEILLQL